MKTDEIYRERIIDCIEKIERFTSGMREKNFLETEVAQSGVILQLALIGELSKKVSVEFKQKVTLPWKNIAGFRDKAVHDYFELDLAYVWLTVQEDLPTLKNVLVQSR